MIDLIPWQNETLLDFEGRLKDYLGFIYTIDLKSGEYYIGRKQFWTCDKRGNKLKETRWRDYCSSSKTIKADISQICRRTIIAVFTSKSALRFAEAAAIVNSGSYFPNENGLNWSFEGCRGTLKLHETDRKQLNRLIARWNP